jgi:hypothetical protein
MVAVVAGRNRGSSWYSSSSHPCFVLERHGRHDCGYVYYVYYLC